MSLDIAQLRESFQKNGYVVVPNFLENDELNIVCERLTKLIVATQKKQNYEHAFYANKQDKNSLKQLHRIEEDDFFKNYSASTKWSSLASALLDDKVEPALALEWFNKPPNYFHETPPHQDNFYFCFEPPQALTIWLALDHAHWRWSVSTNRPIIFTRHHLIRIIFTFVLSLLRHLQSGWP